MINLLTITNGDKRLLLCAEQAYREQGRIYSRAPFQAKVDVVGEGQGCLMVHGVIIPSSIHDQIDPNKTITIALRCLCSKTGQTSAFVKQDRFPYAWLQPTDAYKMALSRSIGEGAGKA